MVRKPQISTGFVTRLFNYGSLYHLFSDDSDSLQSSLERAVSEDSEDKESWSNLGCLLFNKGEYARAESCFERAVKIDRSDAHSWSLNCAAVFQTIHARFECCTHIQPLLYVLSTLLARSRAEVAFDNDLYFYPTL